MTVGRPGISLAETLGEMAIPRRRGGPESERPVNVNPCTGCPRAAANLGRRIECSGVYVARLNADDGPAIEGGQSVRTHSALTVNLDPVNALTPEPQQTQGFQQ